MSVYYAAQWSVRPSEVAACEAALGTIAEHVRSSHPGVRSLQVLRQAWGPNPRRAYLWLEEYASLAAMEAEPETPKCAEVWQPVEDMALEGSYLCSVWTDPNRSLWFSR
jgi:quinol monooxygenase YgiN